MRFPRFTLATLGLAAAVVSIAWLASSARDDRDHDRGDNDSRVEQGFDIAPVPLDLKGKNRELVGLGSYLVNAVGGCNDCHTNPPYAAGGDPFMGQPKKVNVDCYLAGGMQFGPFTSRNLTPENGLPEGHTYQEFLTILRTGKDFDMAHPQFGPLLQVMPWPTFQSMSDHDIRAIYEYLRSIPSIAHPCTGA
ncbi:MAG TPA: hypothetical protein VJR04_16995 [Terriglobales bacterium]|nr:hypothetical protein [Terriglobales bacterium]